MTTTTDTFLHHPDGTHRSTAASANGQAVNHFWAQMRAHTADGHTHVRPTDHDPAAAAKAARIAAERGWDDEQLLDALARFIHQAGLTPLLVQYLEELP